MALTQDPVLPFYKAKELNTRRLKKHYLNLHEALWKAQSFEEPRYVISPSYIGVELYIIAGEIESVAAELEERGVLTGNPRKVLEHLNPAKAAVLLASLSHTRM